MAEGLTLYKLIILYMLRKVNFPLSNTQITDFMTEKEYTDYFHVQEAINDLVDAKLITAEKIRNMSHAIKRDIDTYLRENAFELRNESCTLADYEMTGDGGYAVHCRVNEGKETLIDLTINVTTQEEAERVCTKWPVKSQDIYMTIMTTLL